MAITAGIGHLLELPSESLSIKRGRHPVCDFFRLAHSAVNLLLILLCRGRLVFYCEAYTAHQFLPTCAGLIQISDGPPRLRNFSHLVSPEGNSRSRGKMKNAPPRRC